MFCAHWAMSFRPTAVEPVKLSFLTVGLAVKAAPISSGAPVITLLTPLGMPACCAKYANANAVKGVASAGLMTIVHPAANAAPALRVIMAAGKFQGVIAAQTPTGWRVTMMC